MSICCSSAAARAASVARGDHRKLVYELCASSQRAKQIVLWHSTVSSVRVGKVRTRKEKDTLFRHRLYFSTPKYEYSDEGHCASGCLCSFVLRYVVPHQILMHPPRALIGPSRPFRQKRVFELTVSRFHLLSPARFSGFPPLPP